MKKLPREIMVYQIDECEGTPVYAVAHKLEEIPEEDGLTVGTYTKNYEAVFRPAENQKSELSLFVSRNSEQRRARSLLSH